ncbi:hypothetical protein PYW08_006355 [Mythimna loreyi]|uniref:Uncharacterized protein n=1 Tax=Mythimna loreyi TaxID=667449 RepID=A0ACC2QMY4_9NEOP|nr:hypothetical protein PYW08_006355 [Mythimna loreyi]
MNQRKMPIEGRVNHKAVRRLDFGKVDPAAFENFINRIKEQQEEIILKKTEEYNFDFKKEVPLRGRYEWSERRGSEWVPMEVKELTEVNDNEMTPMHAKTDNRAPPRRRRMTRDDTGIQNSHVKKRLLME